jgi:phosphoglycolate phosphatase
MPSFPLICFDLDGTLIDSRKDISDSINRMLHELGFGHRKESEIAAFVGNGMANLIRQSLGENHEAYFDRAVKIFRKDYDTHCLDATRLYSGVGNALRRIPGRKTVITNKPLSFSEKILKGLQIRSMFDEVLGGDMHFPKKPAPDSVLHLAGKYGVSTGEILFVGDSLLDIHTGKNAGTKTCAVTYGFGKKAELESARPDFVIDEFEDLLKII